LLIVELAHLKTCYFALHKYADYYYNYNVLKTLLLFELGVHMIANDLRTNTTAELVAYR